MAEALSLYIGFKESTKPQRVILVGHDRGARVAHRLAVDLGRGITSPYPVATYDLFEIVGLVIMDILPTAEQWNIFGSTSTNLARSFHWPLLANVDLATAMIKGYGGGNWCKEMMRRWSGPDGEGQRSLQRGEAFDIYARYFDQESVIRATSEDYRAGAEEDVTAQEDDQNKNRKVTVHTLVLYSSDYSGKRYGAQMEEIWSKWMANPKNLEVEEIANSGHFIAEEQPQQAYAALGRFYESCQDPKHQVGTP